MDFRRKKLNWVGYICSVEYDPNRDTRLALVSYKDGEKGYILAPKSVQLGTLVVSVRVSSLRGFKKDAQEAQTVHEAKVKPLHEKRMFSKRLYA